MILVAYLDGIKEFSRSDLFRQRLQRIIIPLLPGGLNIDFAGALAVDPDLHSDPRRGVKESPV